MSFSTIRIQQSEHVIFPSQVRSKQVRFFRREKLLYIKVVVLGESGVGISSLALRFVSDEFQHYTDSTIGACYLSKSSEIGTSQILPSRKVTFEIWDTAGQEKFHSLVPM
jgi:Ras-related protein Rab-5C